MIELIQCLFLALALILAPSSFADAACTLCEGGAAYEFPDREFVVPGYQSLGLQSCKNIDQALQLFAPSETSLNCQSARRLNSLCGCPREENSCDLCPDGSPVGNITARVPAYEDIFNQRSSEDNTPTCQVLEAYAHSYSNADDFCVYLQQDAATSQVCGCPGDFSDMITNSTTFTGNLRDELGLDDLKLVGLNGDIFGAETDEQLDTLMKLGRAASALSMLASIIILLDNLTKFKRLRCKMHHQIMAAMAIFDFISSFAYFLGPLLTPADDELVLRYERKGTEQTCTLQGFLIIWGSTISHFLNASLATFFVLVIVYSWPESKFRKLRRYLIAVPFLMGSILACAAIPFIEPSGMYCSLIPPTGLILTSKEWLGYDLTWGPVLGLYMIPAYISIFYATAAMIIVFRFVRRTKSKSSKWAYTLRRRYAENNNIDSSRPAPASTKTSFRNSIWNRRNNPSNESSTRSTRSTKRSKLQVEVFWQSFYYLVALHLCSLPYLVHWSCLRLIMFGPFELWCIIFFLKPLQGFLNSIVYFRSRISVFCAKHFDAIKERMKKWKKLLPRCSCLRRQDAATDGSPRRMNKVSEYRSEDPMEDLQEMNRASNATQEVFDSTDKPKESRSQQVSSGMDSADSEGILMASRPFSIPFATEEGDHGKRLSIAYWDESESKITSESDPGKRGSQPFALNVEETSLGPRRASASL